MKKISRILIYPFVIMGFLLISTNGCKKDKNFEQMPIVETVSVTEITSNSAVFNGRVVSSGGDSLFIGGLVWSNYITEPQYSSEYSLWGFLVEGSYSFGLGNLTPATTYYVRAYVSTSSGFGFGKVISFTTTGSVTDEIVFNPGVTYGSLSDVDGNTYKTIEIGGQTWMAENLRTTKYNDGTAIPNVTGQDEWSKLKTGAYCWWANDGKYKGIYGAIYNGYAVNSGILCPKGWHIPSDVEWTTLENFVETDITLGLGALKEPGTTHWQAPPSDSWRMTEGTNLSGFTALPGGYRGSVKSFYLQENLGYCGLWWSSTASNSNSNVIHTMSWLSSSVFRQEGEIKAGVSCRCIKN
jgi:uncharacterized protein (TIGR02145 family)